MSQLLVRHNLPLYFSGQLSSCYRGGVPRSTFSRKAIEISKGKITPDTIEFIHKLSKEESCFFGAVIDDVCEASGDVGILKLIASLDDSTPFLALFYDADFSYDWHMNLRYDSRPKNASEEIRNKWIGFSKSFAEAMEHFGINEDTFCEMSGERKSGEGYGMTVFEHIRKNSSYVRTTTSTGNDRGGNLLVFPKILKIIAAYDENISVHGKELVKNNGIASEFLIAEVGNEIAEAYMKLSSYGDSPENMGDDPVFCMSLLRELSSRKALERVLSRVFGEMPVSELVSLVITEKNGEPTVVCNLLAGETFEHLVREFSQELNREIFRGENKLGTISELKKELVPGFSDTDAISDTVVENIRSSKDLKDTAMLFFARKFLVRKN